MSSKTEESKIRKRLKMSYVMIVFVISVAAMVFLNIYIKGSLNAMFGIYGMIMVTYLLGKMILSFSYKVKTGEAPDLKVSVVIPSYNEEPEAVVKTIDSIVKQDYPIHEIFVVDDGSSDLSGYEAALKYRDELMTGYREVAAGAEGSKINQSIPNIIVHRLEKNSGKRHAQAWAFKQLTGDIIFTVDSDGYTHPDAVRNLMIPFNDPEVMAVTGHINARNKNENWFTKLLDMRYENAFRVERAAQSATGNVLVCSGPISCYRADVILDNLEHYTNQTFLGEPVQFGDDRCLTNYAILRGKTLYQSTAKCDTDVPSTLKQFIKQQVRWNKSFFRESLVAFKIGFKKPKTLIWVLLEMSLWLLFGIVILVGLIFRIQTLGLVLLIYYFAYLCLSAYARNVFYIIKNPLVFLMAPLYGLIHLAILFPLRMYALLTLKQNGWGTR
ncbi:glycosyltransferase [Cytobacillus horneckiae]|uniref:glycosyltransferase n=1 Tax=Cytobacillus horneckiae TaxID=549687 RepID=UPI0034CE5A08